jgi:hypothetical protein
VTNVRNQRLAFAKATGDQFISLFKVPDDWCCILRHLEWHNDNAAAGHADVFINAGALGSVWAVNSELGPWEGGRWEGAIAMNPGDYVVLHASQSGITMWASGALLSGPPPWPVMPQVILDDEGNVVVTTSRTKRR